MSRKAAKITIDALQEKIDGAVAKAGSVSYTRLTPQVEVDLGKVSFSTEKEEHGSCGHKETESLLGFQQWGDLTFLGCCAGGDWEHPVFFMIYWDGKRLRGYIPKSGNSWNWKTKEALGNDEDADDDFFEKTPGATESFVLGDINADVRDRIQVIDGMITKLGEPTSHEPKFTFTFEATGTMNEALDKIIYDPQKHLKSKNPL